MSRLKSKSGDALLEVLFGITVISICLITIIAAIIKAVSSTRLARESAAASNYAHEALELVRKERDSYNWEEFKTSMDGDHCLNSSLVWSGCDCASAVANVGIFSRCVKVEADGDEKRKITVTVSWSESGRNHQTQLTTYLTKWNK